MKIANIKNWVIDSLIIGSLAWITTFILPLVSAGFTVISLHIGRTLFWVHSILLGDWLPHIIVGCLLGLVAGRLIRHRKLSIAMLPSVLYCIFFFCDMSFGAEPYPWGQVIWLDLVIVSEWLLLLAASLVCARIVLKKRLPSGQSPAPIAVDAGN